MVLHLEAVAITFAGSPDSGWKTGFGPFQMMDGSGVIVEKEEAEAADYEVAEVEVEEMAGGADEDPNLPSGSTRRYIAFKARDNPDISKKRHRPDDDDDVAT